MAEAAAHSTAPRDVQTMLRALHGSAPSSWLEASASRALSIAASAARIAGSEAFWFAAKENVQTHGGMGFTWAVDCHLYYRRAKQLGLVAGAARSWKERLVSQLERRNAA